MKHFYLKLSGFFLLFLISNIIYAQPVGSNRSNPINVGAFPRAEYSDTRNNSSGNGYGNDMGQISDDIYYKINVTVPGELEVATCMSTMDTYIHVLDDNGNAIASNDDNDMCANYYQSFLRINVNPGTYYVVTEGWYNRTGDIRVYINLVRFGAIARLPIEIGALQQGGSYSDVQNNSANQYFYNNIGYSSDDIYYRFTINTQSDVDISLCASNFDTYLRLLDQNLNEIASNDDWALYVLI